MQTASFNSLIAANGGSGNLVSFRIRGGEVVYLKASFRSTDDQTGSMKFTINGDFIHVYKNLATPMGPQIKSVSVIDIADISEVNFFYDSAIHTDFTEEEAFQ